MSADALLVGVLILVGAVTALGLCIVASPGAFVWDLAKAIGADAWPSIRPQLVKLAMWIMASSPETQARAREDSRQRNEPGKGHGPER